MCLKDVAIEGSEIVSEMLTSTSSPFHLSFLFQITPLKNQLPPASLVIITVSIISNQKKKKKKHQHFKKKTHTYLRAKPIFTRESENRENSNSQLAAQLYNGSQGPNTGLVTRPDRQASEPGPPPVPIHD